MKAACNHILIRWLMFMVAEKIMMLGECVSCRASPTWEVPIPRPTSMS
jgi:hypothetical protein